MDKALIDRLARSVRSAARRRRPPSERNARVFEQVELLGRRQVDVAGELGITQGRVAQICRAVGRWCEEEFNPASQGPEQFRELGEMMCQLAHLRQLDEQAGKLPRSASRLEVFAHAARAFAAASHNISPAEASSARGLEADDSSPGGSGTDRQTVELPTTYGKLAASGRPLEVGAKKRA